MPSLFDSLHSHLRELSEGIDIDENPITQLTAEELRVLSKLGSSAIGRRVSFRALSIYADTDVYPSIVETFDSLEDCPRETGAYYGVRMVRAPLEGIDGQQTLFATKFFHAVCVNRDVSYSGYERTTVETIRLLPIFGVEIDIVDPFVVVDNQRMARLNEQAPELVEEIGIIICDEDLSTAERLHELAEKTAITLSFTGDKQLAADICAYVNSFNLFTGACRVRPQYTYTMLDGEIRLCLDAKDKDYFLTNVTLDLGTEYDTESYGGEPIALSEALVLSGKVNGHGGYVYIPLNQRFEIEEID